MFRANALPALACLPLLLAAAMQSGSCRAGAGANAPSQGVNKTSKQGSPRGSNRNDNAETKKKDDGSEGKMKDETKEKTVRLSADTWGGDHIRLRVNEDGAHITYDCARGTIATPFTTDAGGRFDLRGTHVREHPGPIRLDIKPPTLPARYVGKVSGDEMTLTVTLTDTSEEIGVFTLTRGGRGRVTKCR